MPVASVAIVETASCPSRIPVATLATDETAQAVALPSDRHEMTVGGGMPPVAAAAIVETAPCPSRIPVATLATDETAQAVALPCFPACWSVAPSFLRDLNKNKTPELGSYLVSSKLGALVHQMMVGSGIPVAAVAIVETASCPSRIPVATLATDETAQAVALPSTRHEMTVGGMPVAAVFIPAIVETASRPSRMPVATLAADESALCSSTGRSVARGCGLGCSWEWQAAALRLGRRFGHHGCGG